MEFANFAQRLKPIIGGNLSAGKFVRELFENITEFLPSDNIVTTTEDPTYRAYFNGERKLTRFATKIRKNLEPELFVSYINDQKPEALQDIYTGFRNDIDGMTEMNIPESMAECFKGIIVAASTKKKTKSKVPLVVEAEDEIVPAVDFALLNECNMKCPLCGKDLVDHKKHAAIKRYSKVQIFSKFLPAEKQREFASRRRPAAKLDSFDNSILLCKKCADNYVVDTTADEYEELFDQKERLEKELQSRISEPYDIGIEKGINAILDALEHLSYRPQREDKTTWKAFRVDSKIPDNLILQDTVTDHVLKYYRYIEAQFKQREREGTLRFKKVQNEISQCFELYDEQDLPQKELFDRMVEWIRVKTKSTDRLACQIFMSFFVQNCEVFRSETAE